MGALLNKKLGHIQRIAICSFMKRSPSTLIIINDHLDNIKGVLNKILTNTITGS